MVQLPEIKIVKTRKDLKTFIYLPEKIHKNHKNWVPPIYMDEKVFFNPLKNKAFSYCDTVMAIAYSGKKPVGRIMGIIHRKYNELHKEKDARFCFMETFDDPVVFSALLKFVENWAREKGMQNLIGPLGFSDKDPQGFLIEGFNETMVIATNGNFEYMPRMLEANGYKKKVDCVVYKIKVPEEIPLFYKAVYTRAIAKDSIKVLEFNKIKQVKPYIRPVLTLLNETFTDIYAFMPFEKHEMDDFANRYLLLLDPRFIKVVINSCGEVIGFIIGMPDISKGIIACRGRLLPLGIFKVIRARKNTKQLNLLLGGIKKEYRGNGLDVIMGVKMLETAMKRKMECIDSHLELETNTKVRMEMERMGGVVYKTFRIFEKDLSRLP